ncbi:MAG: outer membrane protein assembly factor BamC [Gammaproteobacteria bacterium]|nr:outer membrane protein assembly factor BamC [Gammaproteobacteria bacterium]
MRYFSQAAVVILVVISLTSCGWMNDGEGLIINPDDDYLDARQDSVLVVPDDLANLEDTDPFPIPHTPASGNPRFYPKRPPLPDAIYANENRDEVRIQRLGTRQWLVIPEPPTTAWPKLKQFMADNGVAIEFDAPSVGRLNTQWLKIDEPSYRDVVRTLLKDAKQAAGLNVGQDRFLIKVEQGLRPRTTEIHIRHENDSLTLPVDDSIVSLDVLNSDVVVAEADLLNEVGAYIAAKVAEQTVSKVALQIGSLRKSELSRDDEGLPVLKLYLDYERAWATMGQALGNAGVEISDLNRQNGVFFVKVNEATFGGEEESRFLCRLTFSCERNEGVDLQIRVVGSAERVFNVSVFQAPGDEPADPELAQQVLVLIKEFSG